MPSSVIPVRDGSALSAEAAALREAVDLAGSQSAIARLLHVTQGAVSKWLRSGRALPADYVLKVEAETGVSKHRLRPDIYPEEQHSDPTVATMDPVR
jgi:DNA-binding transcriptional regulator YdaS (Cro superfamily)